MVYDDETELIRYVLRHYQQLLTPFEHHVEKAIYARAMYESGAVAKLLMEQWGGLDDEKINNALAGGAHAFESRVIHRILADHPNLTINRCQECHRVLRTPLARQCFWCGHSEYN